MELTSSTIIFSLCGILIGFIIAKIFEKSNAAKIIEDAKKQASSILNAADKEGESLRKDKILQAKEKFIELKSEHEKVIYAREDKIKSLERSVTDKESNASTAALSALSPSTDFANACPPIPAVASKVTTAILPAFCATSKA